MSESNSETDDRAADARETGEPTTDDSSSDSDQNRPDLVAQVELLTEENRRLRSEYARARQAQYRETALGLAAIGALAVVSGFLFPDGRDVLFVLGAIGLFGGVLTYYLTPSQFVAAEVGERVYAATAANEAAVADELGLRDDRIYLPGDESVPARLYVPQRTEYELPDDLTSLFVTDTAQRGLVLEPTGSALFREFERALTADLATDPAVLATQLSDGLIEQFELARSAEPDVDAAAGRVTVAITESAFGAVNRFDHPIASFLAVGLAVGLAEPITLEVVAGDDRADWVVTCRWESESGDDMS